MDEENGTTLYSQVRETSLLIFKDLPHLHRILSMVLHLEMLHVRCLTKYQYNQPSPCGHLAITDNLDIMDSR